MINILLKNGEISFDFDLVFFLQSKILALISFTNLLWAKIDF